jgi:hypothetical protein
MSGAASETEENSAAVYRSSNRGESAQVGHSRSGDDMGCSGAVSEQWVTVKAADEELLRLLRVLKNR